MEVKMIQYVQTGLASIMIALVLWFGNTVVEGKQASIETQGEIKALRAEFAGYKDGMNLQIQDLHRRVEKLETRLEKLTNK